MSGLARLCTALLAGTLAGILPTALEAQDAQSIVGRSSRVYRSLASLTADFVQVIDNPMIDSAESRGTLIQAGAAKLSMRFTDPPGEAVVIDGEHVWVYTPSTVPDQVLRLAVPSGGPVYGYNLLAWLLDRPAERYTAKYLKQEKIGTPDDGRDRAGAGRARPAVRRGPCSGSTGRMPCPAGWRSPRRAAPLGPWRSPSCG